MYGTGNKYLQSVVFSCSSGYTLVGDSVLQCQATGSWSTVVPVCRPVECSALTPPEHASLNSTLNTFKDHVESICDTGYRPLSERHTAVCTADGTWSRQLPGCVAIECPALVAPHSVLVLEEGKTFGSQLFWRCRLGFSKVSGNEVRYCGADGQWKGTQLLCEGMQVNARVLFLCSETCNNIEYNYGML